MSGVYCVKSLACPVTLQYLSTLLIHFITGLPSDSPSFSPALIHSLHSLILHFGHTPFQHIESFTCLFSLILVHSTDPFLYWSPSDSPSFNSALTLHSYLISLHSSPQPCPQTLFTPFPISPLSSPQHCLHTLSSLPPHLTSFPSPSLVPLPPSPVQRSNPAFSHSSPSLSRSLPIALLESLPSSPPQRAVPSAPAAVPCRASHRQ